MDPNPYQAGIDTGTPAPQFDERMLSTLRTIVKAEVSHAETEILGQMGQHWLSGVAWVGALLIFAQVATIALLTIALDKRFNSLALVTMLPPADAVVAPAPPGAAPRQAPAAPAPAPRR